MTKQKGRKKPLQGSSTVIRAESQESEYAPDNPGGSPAIIERPDLALEAENVRRSTRLHPADYDTIRIGSDRNTNEFVITEGARDDLEDDLEDTRNPDARSRSSALTPIDAQERNRSSPTRKVERSRSPSDDGGTNRIDINERRSQQLRELEDELLRANERLRLAQEELAREKSIDSSQSPIEDGRESRHSRLSDDNIRQAMRELHTPTRRTGETQIEFNARKAASLRIRQEEVDETTSQTRLTRQDELNDELVHLQMEQIAHNAELIQ